MAPVPGGGTSPSPEAWINGASPVIAHPRSPFRPTMDAAPSAPLTRSRAIVAATRHRRGELDIYLLRQSRDPDAHPTDFLECRWSHHLIDVTRLTLLVHNSQSTRI